MKDNIKSEIFTKEKVKVYTFVDGTDHILFNDIWYDLKPLRNVEIKSSQYIKVNKTIEEINKSKSHKPINTPWSKWNPKKIF